MGFSYFTHYLLSGVAGTAVHSECSLHPFQQLLVREAETGVVGPGPPLQLSAAAEGRGWSLGSQSLTALSYLETARSTWALSQECPSLGTAGS